MGCSQWDPIGGCPADEYDAYVGAVAAMLRDGATNEALMKYFRGRAHGS